MQELQSNRFAIESNKDKNKTLITTNRSRGLFQGGHQRPPSGKIIYTITYNHEDLKMKPL